MTRSTIGTPAGRRRVRAVALLAATAAVGLLSACGAGQITQTDSQRASVPGVNVTSPDGKIALRDVQIAYADRYAPGSSVPLIVRIFNDATQGVRLTGVTSDRGPVVLIGAAPTPVAQSPSTQPPSSGAPSSGASASPSGTVTPSATASPTRRASSSATPSSTASANPSPSATSTSPSPTVSGSTKIDIPVPVASFVVLSREANTYLEIAGLTGAPLMPGESASFTFTFRYDDATTTTVSNVAIPVSPPLTPVPRSPATASANG